MGEKLTMDEQTQCYVDRLERKRDSLAMLAELINDVVIDLDHTLTELKDHVGLTGQQELPLQTPAPDTPTA